MRLKLLLFALFISGSIFSQDTIRSLVITESRMDGQPQAYVEITNMGDEAVNLKNFEFGLLRPWGVGPWTPEANRSYMLPDFVLEPGKSFVQCAREEFGPKQFKKGLDGFSERQTKTDVIAKSDFVFDVPEGKGGPGTEDLITSDDYWTWETWDGRGCFYIEQHISDVDSVVIDQVGGVFDGSNGLNESKPYDVAGITDATRECVLIRKFSVKTGNLDFANARGIGEDDSEWIPIPLQGGSVWRSAMWTLGNHVNAVLDENTLESDVADIDFAAKTITVPWGTRRIDDIMLSLMKEKPGIAWNYFLSPAFEDSLTFAARTGDQLEVIACGDVATRATFDIIVKEPTADANIVVPVADWDPQGNWRETVTDYQQGWPRVTRHANVMDSIWGSRGGIPFATRVDSLLERLEFPANATHEFKWVDGVERADLKDGDILQVKAQNGDVKEYYVAVVGYRPSHDATLSSITWPDIPDFYKGIFGWIGDTIPNFGSGVFDYRVQVPLDADGIPALIGKTNQTNAKIQVDRAKSLSGTVADRTATFTVQAEDDTTFRFYHVEMVKEQNPVNIQPFYANPFFSEHVFWDQWSNSFGEVCNPGNQPLDLSNYMFLIANSVSPAEAITWYMETDGWMNRFRKYVPGYKWVDEAQWAVTPGILVQDLNVNPIVMPGDVFALGSVYTTGQLFEYASVTDWPVLKQLDVQFNNFSDEINNPWNEPVGDDAVRQWVNGDWFLFKILNDSIKKGLKPANDPNDFELIDVMGMGDGSMWNIAGSAAEMITTWIRKPNYTVGKTGFQESFGTNTEDSEWTKYDWPYFAVAVGGWPEQILAVTDNIGQHFFNPPTYYMSTVSSTVYKVSPGYGQNNQMEEIRGMTTGTTVGTFLSNIIKKDENQGLTVKSGETELTATDILSNGDMLIVMSADSTNTTKYNLEVTAGGLSSDAVLTSSRYNVEITSQPKSASDEGDAGAGKIKGFEYGTSLKTVIANINVPVGASMDVVDGDGAYISLVHLNYDTTYVNVTVNSNTYFDVLAENGVTRIVYQLVPDVSENAAFITSDIYAVVQKDVLVKFVPRGTTVQTFMANIVPSEGATVKIVDKLGLERTSGSVADDDKVIVTSPNGLVTTVYFISKLATEFVQETTYLAYLTSKVYAVDQVQNIVSGVSGNVADFLSKVTASMGATAMVVDASGTTKASGNIDGGDMVKVISADGGITVMYDITTVGIDPTEVAQFNLYPNPTEDIINVNGVKTGNRIQVFNAMGSAIRDINVENTTETISLGDQPAGMYMIVISDDNKMLGRYKALRR